MSIGNFRHLRLGLALAVGLACFAGLYYLYQSSARGGAFNISEVNAEFRALERLDSEWNADVLRSRTGLNKNYDAVIRPLTTVDQISEQMTATIGDLAKDDKIKSLIEDIQKLFERKITLIDNFKSQDALLKNSMRYFPTAVTELSARVGTAPAAAEITPLAQNFMNRMLHAASTGDADSMTAGSRLLEQLRQKPQLADAERTGNFLLHAATIHDQLAKSDAVLAEINTLPVAKRIGELNGVINTIFEQNQQQQRLYRAALIGLSLVLLLAVVVLGWYLWRSYRRLEVAVADRTRELSHTLDELRDTQAQVVQTEKMSSLGQMVAGIVHEINTPIAYVKNSLQLVEAQLQTLTAAFGSAATFLQVLTIYPRDDVDARRHFRQARDSMRTVGTLEDLQDLGQTVTDSLEGVARITEIVGDLKNFSRLDRAAFDVFDVNKGFDATLSIARNLVKHIAVVKDYGLVRDIWCSPSQINQVMLNLITNACQATAGRDSRIVLRSRMAGDSVEFEVEDNGSGISNDALPKIFDPFFTTKRVGEGTGLGLSIVKKIVDSHKGQITVKSVVGQGTTFTVILPTGEPAMAQAA